MHNEFGTLENILANTDNIKKPSIKNSIMRNAEKLRTNYKIIKLDNSAQLPFAMSELTYNFTGITTNEVLKGMGVK